MTDARTRAFRLLIDLHTLIAAGKGDDAEADDIRDQISNGVGHNHAWLAYLSAALYRLRDAENEACAAIARVQSFYPDTHTGMRQQWVKDQIAAAIEARKTK